MRSDSGRPECPTLEEGLELLEVGLEPLEEGLAGGTSALRLLWVAVLGGGAALLVEGCGGADFLLSSFPPLQASLLSKGL